MTPEVFIVQIFYCMFCLECMGYLHFTHLSGDQRIPTSTGVVTQTFTGCLRSHYLTLAANRPGVEIGSCESPP